MGITIQNSPLSFRKGECGVPGILCSKWNVSILQEPSLNNLFKIGEEYAHYGNFAGRSDHPLYVDCPPKLPMSRDQCIVLWNDELSIGVVFFFVGLRIFIVAVYDSLRLRRGHLTPSLRPLGFTILMFHFVREPV